MNEMNYEGVEYGSLDQAVLQEYVDLKCFEQQPKVDVKDDLMEIGQMLTTRSQSLVECTTDFSFRDKDQVLLNFSHERERQGK